jgi:pimeloyl-ACP methyl ester carboxylesterase
VLASRPAQVLASTYIGLFQLPALPEAALGALDRALLKRTLRRMHLRPDALTAADLGAYDAAFAGPGALRAALDYYRAIVRHSPVVPEERRRLPHRTLLLWGERDPALLTANAEGLERWVPDLRVVRVPDAGHWVMADAPEVVNRALLAHLRA